MSIGTSKSNLQGIQIGEDFHVAVEWQTWISFDSGTSRIAHREEELMKNKASHSTILFLVSPSVSNMAASNLPFLELGNKLFIVAPLRC
jgi:hypothetical protein